MKYQLEWTLLAAAVLAAAAQTTLPPIEAQFRIVGETVDRRTTVAKLVQRCMAVHPQLKSLGFLDNTPEQDATMCQSTDTLFTIVKTQSDSDGNFFIGDYSAGTAQKVFVHPLSFPREVVYPFTVNNATDDVGVARVMLNDTTNRLNSLTVPGSAAVTTGKVLFLSNAYKAPFIMRVTPNRLRQFRLKRLDPNTNVTSCAILVGPSKDFVRFPPSNNQTAADEQCARKRSIFTFNTQTGRLSIEGRRVRVDEKRRLRTAVNDTQPSNLFYLRPGSFGFDDKTGCGMCRIDGGLMVAQPANTLATGPNGYIVANGDYDRAITSEFWPEFI